MQRLYEDKEGVCVKGTGAGGEGRCGEREKENVSKPDMRIKWETYSNIKLLFF